MKTIEKILLWEEAEYTYPLGFGFLPSIHTYLHEEADSHPAMIVVPGGGYSIVSPTEAEIVALTYYDMGFNVFVLTYTTNFFMTHPLHLQPLQDLSRAVRLIRARAEEFHIHPSQLVISGFSAGAHLCGSLCVHYKDIKDVSNKLEAYSNRPDAAILSYPVVSTEKSACHTGSFLALYGLKDECSVFGADSLTCADASLEDISYMSLEKHVTADTPPCFVWQTITDEAVSVKNSFYFAQALQEQGVPYAYHVFSTGKHGHLAGCSWEHRQYGPLYTLEQADCVVKAYKEGKIFVKEKAYAEHCLRVYENLRNLKEIPSEELNDEVSVWPELVKEWLRTLWEQKKQVTFSILGDSYSTYEGWIPQGYNSWYGSWRKDVKDVSETWWYQLAQKNNWKLLDNCSFGGSTICTTGYNGVDFEQSFIGRMKQYFNREAVNRPDVLLVEGGINDTYTSPHGTVQYENWSQKDLEYSLPAFCYMLQYLKENQPQARIIVLISFLVDLELETGYIEACEHFGVEYVIFPSGEMLEGHPTAKGHKTIYNSIKNQI